MIVHASYGKVKSGKLVPFLSEIESSLSLGIMGSIIESNIRKKGYDGSSATIRNFIFNLEKKNKNISETNKTLNYETIYINRQDAFKLLFHPKENTKKINQVDYNLLCEQYPLFETVMNQVWSFKKLFK